MLRWYVVLVTLTKCFSGDGKSGSIGGTSWLEKNRGTNNNILLYTQLYRKEKVMKMYTARGGC